MGRRLSWRQICRTDDFRGRWVALDNCRFDHATAVPAEGDVIDADEDLAELCKRIREADRSHCSIVFCDDDPESAPMSRPSLAGSRAVQH